MGNNPTNGVDPDGGWKTKWGRFWAWVGGGFKGSFIGSGNASDPMKNYGIRTTETTSFSETDGGFRQEISITDNYGIRNAQLSAARDIYETQNFVQSLNDMGMEVHITNNRREAMNSNINFMTGLALPSARLPRVPGVTKTPITKNSVIEGYKVSNHATKGGTQGLKTFGSLTEKFGEGYKSVAVAQGKHLSIELGKKLNSMSPGSWSKIYEAGILNGSKVEVHYFYNSATGQYVNPFIKMGKWGSKAFKGL